MKLKSAFSRYILVTLLSLIIFNKQQSYAKPDMLFRAIIQGFLSKIEIMKPLTKQPRRDYKCGVHLNAGGPGCVASCSFDYFAVPSLRLEGGLGFYGIFIGTNYHFFGQNKSYRQTPYLGCYLFVSNWGKGSIGGIYLPAGLHIYNSDRVPL